MDTTYVEEDATDIPLNEGSAEIPDNIYSSTLNNTNHKGVYLPIAEGSYTAVCTILDSSFINLADDRDDNDEPNTVDIVANYTIAIEEVSPENALQFFEIAFDVRAFLDGDDDKGWFDEARDNPFTGPHLVKAQAKKVKKIVKDNVTYYILHRAKK
jgi:hypothetical protein